MLVRKHSKDGIPGELIAFVHFRFTVQGEVMDTMCGDTCLYVWDIHVDEAMQRKGLGRHLLTIVELIARREEMKYVSIPIQLNDDQTTQWLNKVTFLS